MRGPYDVRFEWGRPGPPRWRRRAAVADSTSGRELAEAGFGGDVAIAVEIDSCHLVPVLADGAFTAANGRQGPTAGGLR